MKHQCMVMKYLKKSWEVWTSLVIFEFYKETAIS